METIKITKNKEKVDIIIHDDNEIDYVKDIDLDKTVNITIIGDSNNEKED